MSKVAVGLISLVLTSVSFAQTTVYWTGNEDRWGGGSQTGTADDNFSLTPGGADWKKVSAGETYHHVYDRSPAGLMPGANYTVSMNRANQTIASMALVGSGGDGFTFNTVGNNSLGMRLAGPVTASDGWHGFLNGGGNSLALTTDITFDVAAGAGVTLGYPLTGTFGITKTGSGSLLMVGDHLHSGETGVSGGIFGGNGSLGGNLGLASGTRWHFDEAFTLSVAGTTTFSHASFGIADLVGLDSSTAEGTYTLITGTVVGNFDNVGWVNAADIGGGKSAYFEVGGLNLIVVPEPSIFALAGVGLAGLLLIRRRGTG
ncbi:MAG TPA: PEP-CTERM sorting domain-containing protein [Verrucomicrobiota bacterium]|nr:PEP-CTERM sorting domain-containing protein [Verrucomicrobiota bacterium]